MSGIGTWGSWLLGIILGSAYAFSANCATAQITPDRTLPNNSSVTINGSVFNITGGTQAGRNLFHSFQEFSVPTGGTASFMNGADIQNIISRVTGGSVSNIDGLIKALGTANLFFLNPSGIVFGKNASLNIGGSFVATTANAIQFGNQGTFSASMPNNPALLTVNPSALFYNQIAAGTSIQNNSIASAGVAPTGASSSGLRVPDGKSLLLVGGDINMDGGRLRAYGGHVELGGLVSPGTVELVVDGNNLSLSFPMQSTRGAVSLTNGANINVSAGNGGSITVNASDLNITDGSFLTAGIAQGLGNVGAKAGDITFNATGDIKIDGNGSSIANNVQQQAIGDGGNITLSSSSLELTGGAQISASTYGQGNTGNVILNATKSVSLDGSGSAIFSTVGSVNNSQDNIVKGNGGNIQITTDQLQIFNGVQLNTSTFGQGNAGNVIIDTTKSISLDNGSIFSTVGYVNNNQNNLTIGKGGNIQITTDQLSISNGTQLVANTFGQGDAGNVIINANKSVSVDNGSIFNTVGYVNNNQNNLAIGKGGNIQITTDQLSLFNSAVLVASTFGQGNAGNVIIDATKSVSLDNGYIFNTVGVVNNNQNNLAIGKGGNIQIKTDQLSLSNGAQLQANTFGQGDAGNVIINANKSVSFDGSGSGISSSVGDVYQNYLPQGCGGNIQITTGELSLTNGAQLAASTYGQGNAGNVIIDANKSVYGSESTIFSTVGSVNNNQNNIVKGNGGNIWITTDEFSLSNAAQLEASTYGQGNAGNISIKATDTATFVGVTGNTSSGILSTVESTGVGKGGNIDIQAGSLSLTNNAVLQASSAGQGNAGNIMVQATNTISLAQSFIFSNI